MEFETNLEIQNSGREGCIPSIEYIIMYAVAFYN